MGCARVDGAVDARCDATSARETDVGARRPRPSRRRETMSLSTSPVLAAAASNDLAQVRWLLGERTCRSISWETGMRNRGSGERFGEAEANAVHGGRSHGSLEVLLYVLQMGADPNLRSEDEDRCTAMHCAAAGGAALSTDAIKALLLFGADRNAARHVRGECRRIVSQGRRVR